ncbi:MAG: hypothetical protein U5K75_00020 [Ahrensia sp.]|nr:hypothetical protein [Ahrensia sp.]
MIKSPATAGDMCLRVATARRIVDTQSHLLAIAVLRNGSYLHA